MQYLINFCITSLDIIIDTELISYKSILTMTKLSNLSIKHFMLLLALISLTVSFTFEEMNQADCGNPKLIEFLSNYTLPTDDLKTLVKENISSLNIDDIKSKNVTFTQIKLTLNYIGGKKVTELGSLQIQVSNDSFTGNLKWAAEVKKTIGHDSFNVTATLKPIPVKYIKSYVLSKKQYQITNLTYTFTSDMITNITITPNQSKKAGIEQVVKNQLYNQVNKKFKSLQSWLNDIASKQKIGQLFTSDKYEYKFYNLTLTVDTSPILVDLTGNNVLNGFKGDIVGTTSSFCPTGVPRAQPGFRMFISLAFAQSLAQATLQRHIPYKNVLINGSNTRTDAFQWRLADLQYVLSGVPQKYSQLYMRPVSFTCSLSQVTSVFTKSNKMYALLKWNCSGHLWIDSSSSIQIIDCEIQSKHEFFISISGSYLTVYSNVITILEETFNPVGQITVKDKDLAKTIMKQFLNDLRVYTPGTYFKIPENSHKLEIISETDFADGIWIG